MGYMSHASPQFQQLAMFATPEEIAGMHSGDYHKPVGQVTSQDMRDAHGVSEYREGSSSHASYMNLLKTDIAKNGGIEHPVHVHNDGTGRQTLMDGHHRARAAMQTGRLVPVVHHEGVLQDAYDDAFLGEHASPYGWSQ